MLIKSLWKAIIAGSAVIAVQMPSQADADILGGYFDIVNSYRQDKFSVNLNTFDSKNNLVEKNKFDLKDISLYQLGAKGQLVACNFFARGEAYWGWADNGSYRENSRIWNGSPLKTRAHLHKGRTRDFTVGGGYFLPACGLINIGPSGGWSYQSQEFTIHRARIQGFSDDSINGLEYSNRWQGPWAGADAQLNFCGFELRGGYSYHWATWQGKWHLKGCEGEGNGFTEKCRSSDATGQVAYVDALWSICPLVELGLGFKWQRWEAKKGKQKHDKHAKTHGLFGNIVAWRETDKIKNAIWESFTVSLDLGVAF